MENKLKLIALGRTVGLVLLTALLSRQILAQEMRLVAENQRSNEQVQLVKGTAVSYKTSGTTMFVSGTINGFTDSTIVFANKKSVNITVRQKDVLVIELRRSVGRNIAGTCMVIIGSLGTFVGLIAVATPPSGSNAGANASGVSSTLNTAGLIIGAVGLPLLAGGIALKGGRKINLEKSWKLKVVHSN